MMGPGAGCPRWRGSGKSEAWQNNKLLTRGLQAAVFDTHNPGVCVWQPRLPAGVTRFRVRKRVFQG
jgi:hypothetical protein